MKSDVYFVKARDSEGIEAVSDKLSMLIDKSAVLDFIKAGDFTAVKVHFGEVGNTGHIRHQWVARAVDCAMAKTQNVFVSDSNVIYKIGRRANSIEHLRLADEHGFNIRNIGAPILIADGLRGMSFTEVPVSGKHFSSAKISSDFASSNSMLVMSHMTGHIVTGMGSAIKNIGMGCAARQGKYEQHCGAAPAVDAEQCVGCGECIKICPAGCLKLDDQSRISFSKDACQGCGECAVVCRTKAIEIRWSEELEMVQHKMVEYAKALIGQLNGKLGYINFLIKITKDCDCLAKDDPRIVDDIGILASRDPVAIDKASVDLTIQSADGDIFKSGYPQTDWSSQLRYAEKLGLGSMEYELKVL